uniref:ART-PolyVal-like domain-containing protein n=1 Tax=viral metagenome TaxID=1070528 RepID=A0A6M3Y3G6_9ZZZZ
MAIKSLRDIQLTEEDRQQIKTPTGLTSIATENKQAPKKAGGMGILSGLANLSDKTIGAMSRGVTSLVQTAAKPVLRTLVAPVAVAESLGAGIGSGFKDTEAMMRPFEEGVDLGPLGTYVPVGTQGETFGDFATDVVGTGIEVGATLMPVGKGATLAKGLIGKQFLKGLATGVKYGAPAGAGFEFGASIRDRAGLLETAGRTGLGAAGGALFGGLSMGMIPLAGKVWRGAPKRFQAVQGGGMKELVSSKSRATISRPFKKVGAMAEESAEKSAKVAQMSSIEQEAVGTGLDVDFTKSISESAKSGNRGAFTEMMDIAEAKSGDMFNKELIEQVPGRGILDRAKFVISKRDQAGKKIGQLVESVGKKTSDVTEEIVSFRKDLANFGIQVKADGSLRSTGRLAGADVAMIEKMYNLVRSNDEGQVLRSVKQIQQIRQRLFDEFDLAKGPTGDPTYTAAVDRLGDKLHSYLINGINRVDERYGVLAKEYATTSKSLGSLAKLMNYKGRLQNITTKDLKAGEISRRMAGNAADKTLTVLSDLESVAVNLGYDLKDNIYDQVIFATALRRMYGLGQPNAIEGAITQGISQTALDLGRGRVAGTLIKGIDAIIAPNKKLQQKALRKLLNEAIETIEETAPKITDELMETVEETLPKGKGVAPSKAATESAKSVDKALLKEAKKYKTADEFIEAQGEPVYHGSNSGPLEKFDNKKGGAFFTDDYADATGYAGGPDNVYEGYLHFKKPLIIDAKGAKWDNLNTKFGKTTQEIVGNAEKSGYDGVTFKNIVDNIMDTEGVGESTVHFAIKPEDAFVNESQLTDIWKQAQKGEAPVKAATETIEKVTLIDDFNLRESGISPFYKNVELKSVKAFSKSSNQSRVGEKFGIKFELGDFGKNAIKRKIKKADRFEEKELEETIEYIKNGYRASSDEKNYRFDNVAWLSEMPNGEKRIIYTRKNKNGNEEILNWHILNEEMEKKYITTLENNGSFLIK